MLSRLRAVAAHIPPAGSAKAALATAAGQTVHNDNPACCSVPAAASDYTPKGCFQSYAGFDRVYTTGPASSALALVTIYDIFGFKPQTQQGADLLAAALDARVVMPDFFSPSPPWDTARHPPKTPEDKAALQAFFGGPANPPDAVDKLLRVARTLKADGAKRVVAYGLCWGGKVAILAGSKIDTPLDAIATIHPAMLKAEDTVSLDIPMAIYVSKDEPQDQYEGIVNILKAKPFADKNDFDLYPTMFHGWAGARADLNNPENKKLFEDVYGRLAQFVINSAA
ncbi:dienelactone hydrolase [Amylostereum chailletii]|nr:dienelactone hydrolase [Amylostereum chailletii]